jgi:hypothetical protein
MESPFEGSLPLGMMEKPGFSFCVLSCVPMID